MWKAQILDRRKRLGLSTIVKCSRHGQNISQRHKISVDHRDPRFIDFVETWLRSKDLTYSDLRPLFHYLDTHFRSASFCPPHEGQAEQFRAYHRKFYKLDLICEPHPKLQLLSIPDNSAKG